MGKQILVVHPDFSIYKVEGLLRKAKANLITATNQKAALEIYKKRCNDLDLIVINDKVVTHDKGKIARTDSLIIKIMGIKPVTFFYVIENNRELMIRLQDMDKAILSNCQMVFTIGDQSPSLLMTAVERLT